MTRRAAHSQTSVAAKAIFLLVLVSSTLGFSLQGPDQLCPSALSPGSFYLLVRALVWILDLGCVFWQVGRLQAGCSGFGSAVTRGRTGHRVWK